MSTLCRPMMTIVADTPDPKGIHDVHNRMCNRFLFESHGVEVQDGFHEIISRAVAEYGIAPEEIPDTMDVFMNYQHNCETHRWEILTPVSKPGDYIEFRSEMDVLVGRPTAPRTAHGGNAQLHADEDRGAWGRPRSSTRNALVPLEFPTSQACGAGRDGGHRPRRRAAGRSARQRAASGLALFHDWSLAQMDRDGIVVCSIVPSLFLPSRPSRPRAHWVNDVGPSTPTGPGHAVLAMVPLNDPARQAELRRPAGSSPVGVEIGLERGT
jgi:hypothetical protein